MQKQEQEIIQKILTGDIDAYKIIVDRYADELTNLAYRYLNSAEEARDAVQDVFLKAYMALHTWEPRALLKTWLYRIAMNHCLNLVRRKQKITFESIFADEEKDTCKSRFEPADPNDNAEKSLIENQEKKKIWQCIHLLPENQMQVIILYYYQKLSYKEVAEVLDTSVSSIESRLFRAKKALAKILEKKRK